MAQLATAVEGLSSAFDGYGKLLSVGELGSEITFLVTWHRRRVSAIVVMTVDAYIAHLHRVLGACGISVGMRAAGGSCAPSDAVESLTASVPPMPCPAKGQHLHVIRQ